MNFIISASTDVGIRKNNNQDALSVKVINTPQGRMVFAILCDGMGGLDKGELASATVIKAFDKWIKKDLPELCKSPIELGTLKPQWENIISTLNKKIAIYGARQGIKLGTTAVIMLLTQDYYYIMNVGDSRAYILKNGIKQITRDHTFVAREIEMGRMTEEQAKTDERRNIILQCVGASDAVYPDTFYGSIESDAVYMLCSDGFRHEVTADEINESLRPDVLFDEYTMKKHIDQMIELNKQRSEQDNISVVLIRTF